MVSRGQKQILHLLQYWKDIIVSVYVDDLLILRKIQQINRFKNYIKSAFVAKDIRPANHILSMKITEGADGSIFS